MVVSRMDVADMVAPEVQLDVRELDAQGFAPYGDVLAAGRSLAPELSTGHWSIELVRLPAGFGGGGLPNIARHGSYDQVMVGTKGVTLLAVATARSAEESSVASSDVVGFALRPGQTVLVRRGTWHTTVPLGGDSEFVNITRRDDSEQAGQLGDADREYVTTVTFDNAVSVEPPES
jgi:ureidoglycolate hydrolase